MANEQSWAKFWWRNLQGFGTVKFLFYSPEYLEGLIFSATFGEAEKIKVVVSIVYFSGVSAAFFASFFRKKEEWGFPFNTEKYLNIKLF